MTVDLNEYELEFADYARRRMRDLIRVRALMVERGVRLPAIERALDRQWRTLSASRPPWE